MQMNALAIDWITQNVYWTDGQYKLIGVITLAIQSNTWKVIIDKNLSSPQDIVVNPVRQ